jgi:hypothetical protein
MSPETGWKSGEVREQSRPQSIGEIAVARGSDMGSWRRRMVRERVLCQEKLPGQEKPVGKRLEVGPIIHGKCEGGWMNRREYQEDWRDSLLGS